MKPSERINRTYDLKSTVVEILLDNGSIRVPVTVRLELSPRPKFILDCEFSSKDYATTNEMSSKREVSILLENRRQIDTVVGNRWGLGGGKVRNVLIPKREPVTVRADNALLARCKFALLNFPSLWGEKDILRSNPTNPESSFIYQRFQLEAGPWFINVIAVDSLMAVHYSLTREGGSAITHIGSITRSDGQEFSLNDLDKLLKSLHLFVSFARGSYCGLTLLSGHNSDHRRVWEQWGTYKVEPWRQELMTWVDGSNSHTLSLAFEGLWKLLNDQCQSETISQVIHWYVRSNESIEPEVSIVLNHAALERLSFSIVGPQDVKKGDWIAQALDRMGINPRLPTHCQELSRLQEQFGSVHGPHALVIIRNYLIHPDNKYGPFSEIALVEAQTLGLHYIEMMLLRLSCYTGPSVNRLKIMKTYQS